MGLSYINSPKTSFNPPPLQNDLEDYSNNITKIVNNFTPPPNFRNQKSSAINTFDQSIMAPKSLI